jgi:hypothetical protein
VPDFKIRTASSGWVSPDDIRTKSEYIYRQNTKFIASDPENDDNFGYSVDLSSYGTTAIVGAYQEDTSPNIGNGAAYIFTRSATYPNAWTQQQKLVASDPATNDYFGFSVALSGDDDFGNTAIVSASQEDTSPNTNQGAAYVFTRSGTTWTQQAKLLASDAASSDLFGSSVDLSSDGNTALIGASGEDTSPNTDNGASYIFTRSISTWTQQQKLLASDATGGDLFGISTALSLDGNTAIVGAHLETTSPNTYQGAAYVFTRSGTTWTQQQKLLASDAVHEDSFGYSIALSSDGNTALIGAPDENTSPNINQGAAYVFTRSGTTWTQQAKLLASDPATHDYFGSSVDLSSDGNIALIGAPNKTYDGAAYIFTRSGSTWTQQQKMLASDSDAVYPADNFGCSVALSSNTAGNFYLGPGAEITALIGAFDEDTSPNTDNGAAYIFEPNDWARVNVVSVNNGGTWSVGYSLPPGAPTLTVSNVGSMYTLAWNRPLSYFDITGYSLQIAQSPFSEASWSILGDPGLSRSWTFYQPSGLTITNYYRVAAKTQYVTGPYSNSLLVFTV